MVHVQFVVQKASQFPSWLIFFLGCFGCFGVAVVLVVVVLIIGVVLGVVFLSLWVFVCLSLSLCPLARVWVFLSSQLFSFFVYFESLSLSLSLAFGLALFRRGFFRYFSFFLWLATCCLSYVICLFVSVYSLVSLWVSIVFWFYFICFVFLTRLGCQRYIRTAFFGLIVPYLKNVVWNNKQGQKKHCCA